MTLDQSLRKQNVLKQICKAEDTKMVWNSKSKETASSEKELDWHQDMPKFENWTY